MECVLSKFDCDDAFRNGEGKTLLVQLGLQEEAMRDAFDVEDIG